MFKEVSRLLTKLDIVDCSFLSNPIIPSLPTKDVIEEEHMYYEEPNICLIKVEYS